MKQAYDMLIIGSGPAGMSAAVYAARAGMSALIIEETGISGGQVLNTYEVDNYPGLPGISGFDLSVKMKEHVEKLGVKMQSDVVEKIINQDELKLVVTNQANYLAKTVVIASGAQHAKLNIPGEEQLSGMGVSYCATCDGAFFRGKEVAVVGGGDVAVEDAIFLARFCEKVYLIHRRDKLRAAKSLQETLMKLPNVEIVWNSVVDEIVGEDQVDGIRVSDTQTKKQTMLFIQGVFVAVGIVPNSNYLKGVVALNEDGYVIADESCETNIPGIYAAGDIRSKQLRQIITAAADGANAVTSAERYLMTLE